MSQHIFCRVLAITVTLVLSVSVASAQGRPADLAGHDWTVVTDVFPKSWSRSM